MNIEALIKKAGVEPQNAVDYMVDTQVVSVYDVSLIVKAALEEAVNEHEYLKR